jgi:hypothetical protein
MLLERALRRVLELIVGIVWLFIAAAAMPFGVVALAALL